MAVYSAEAIDIIIADIPMEGFADGEFLTIEYDSDAFSDKVGSDGFTTRSKSSDLRATVTVKLEQGSPTNDLLSALFVSDINAANGAGIGSFLCRDNNGRSLYTSKECWIAKHPDISFDRESGSREWKIRCSKLIPFTGGND